MSDAGKRRPIRAREAGAARSLALWLAGRQVTPNQISLASVAFALCAAIALLAFGRLDRSAVWGLPVAAAVFIQLRLLCNLLDGMVAIEGGMRTPSGELFNDVPDRLADPLILVGAGYAITGVGWAAAAGWLAALLSIMTAYVRTLAASTGAPMDFRGPMAKQHRMAVLTVACLAVAVEVRIWGHDHVLTTALVIIVLGCLITVARRALAAYRHLEGLGDD